MSTILLLLDIQNLWNGVREQYGKRARVNLQRVFEKARIKKTDKVIAYAFVVLQPDKNQQKLIEKLEELGCIVVTMTPEAFSEDLLLADMVGRIMGTPDAAVVTVASNDPQVIDVLKAANLCNKHTVLMGFSTRMDTTLANEADDIRLFSKDDILIQ